MGMTSLTLAEVPRTISYQGVLKDEQGWTVPDGDYDITFRLYDSPDDPSYLWEETQMLFVSGGVFNAILGEYEPLDLPFDQDYWLAISVMGDPEMEPRVQLTSSPYSLRAAFADSVAGMAVSDGDWYVDGINMYSGVDGNVGIGTHHPESDLSVIGTIRGAYDDSETEFVSMSHGGANGFINWVGDGRLDFRYDSGTLASLTQGGYLGIGITDPTARLEIQGYNECIRASGDASMGRWVDMLYHSSIGPLVRGNTYTRLTLDAYSGHAGSIVLGLNGDNVGIGIQNPTAKLDVVGTVKMTGFSMPTGAASGLVLTSNGSGVGTWQPGGSGSMPPGAAGQTLHHNGTSWTASNLLYNDGVNVAVGTTSPTRLFDVEAVGAGPGGAQARIKEYSNNWDGAVLQLGKSRANTLGQDVMTQMGDTLGVVDGFGIDMSGIEQVGARMVFIQPGEGIPPFVPGSIAFQTSDGVTVPTERMIITAGGNVGVGVSPSRMFDVGGNALIRGNLGVQGDTDLQGRLDVNGVTTLGDTLDMGGSKIVSVAAPTEDDDAATKSYVDSAVQVAGGITGNGTVNYIPKYASSDSLANSVIYEATGGKVGIATSSAKNRLDVEGALAVGNGYSGMFTAPANGMIVEGNVGIGTEVAGSRLEIEGSGNTTSTSALHVKDSGGNSILYVRDDGAVGIGTTTLNTPYVRLKVNGGLEVDDFIQTANTGGLDIRTTSGTSGLYLDTNAKIGLGTVSPKNRLDVEGAAAIGASYSGTNTAPDNSLIVQSKVGIGTHSPTYALDVAGSAGFNDFLYHNDDTDTYISFQSDEMALFAAGSKLVHVDGVGSHQVLINDDGGDVDFRVESDTDGHALFVRGSDGRVGIGTSAPATKLDVDGTTRTEVLEITGGSDLAEPFVMSGGTLLDPGTVVVIDEKNPGALRMSERAYDKRVAGIISGAGGVRPGLTLNQEDMFDQGQNVALTGRVWCKADASYGAIEPGDRLTTSGTPGHAMKVMNDSDAPGAVIGKAMTSLSGGRGLVLVLVQPQ
jgi:hypothetical protein